MKEVSAGYSEVDRADVEALAAALDGAWRDESIPDQQRELVVAEIEKWKRGESSAPFDAFRTAFLAATGTQAVLDVGCSSGYYLEVLRIMGWNGRYVGADYSDAMIRLARLTYPWQGRFVTADARHLTGVFGEERFDMVIDGSALLHVAKWKDVLAQEVALSNRHVMLHRLPVSQVGRTRYWKKEAYGVPCIEIHFDPVELTDTMEALGMEEIEAIPTGQGNEEMKVHTMLYRKRGA